MNLRYVLPVVALLTSAGCTNLYLNDAGESTDHNARVHRLHDRPAVVDRDPTFEGTGAEKAMDAHRQEERGVDERRLLIDMGN